MEVVLRDSVTVKCRGCGAPVTVGYQDDGSPDGLPVTVHKLPTCSDPRNRQEPLI